MNVEITGPKILWESSWSVPLLGKFQLTESLLDAWIILAAIALLCWWLGRGLPGGCRWWTRSEKNRRWRN